MCILVVNLIYTFCFLKLLLNRKHNSQYGKAIKRWNQIASYDENIKTFCPLHPENIRKYAVNNYKYSSLKK